VELKDEYKSAESAVPSRVRSTTGRWIAIAFSVFVIYSMVTLRIHELQQLSLFLAFTLALAFIRYPLRPKKPNARFILWTDLVLAGVSFVPAVYICIDFWNFVERAGIPTPWDILLAFLTLLLILEATRRTVGLALLIIVVVFLLYAFFGNLLPAPLSNKGYDVMRVTTTLFMTQNGVFGVALKVMSNFIFLFMVFGAFFSVSGATEFFIDLACSLFGRLRGGPAKIAVVSSGLMGTISGSAVANTVTTGSFTIPLMKKIGFESHVAGAVEATASTGGQLMPPVMGAAAFVMAEFLGIPYIDVCKAAAIPAILYYLAIYCIVHLYSIKVGLQGLPASEIPNFKKVIGQKWVFIVPILVLIVTLVMGYSTRIAVLYAIVATIVMSMFKKETRITPSKFVEGLARSGYDSVMVACACGAAGIVIGVVLMTGTGMKITNLVLQVSEGSLAIALVLVMLASILFGMGLPTVVCYLLLAATVAPSLVKMGAMPIAAHLFIFYFGMLCMVTPPVGFAFYAGAAIANADPMKTGWMAWKLALAGFVLPYVFVYNPSLLMIGTTTEVILAFLSATLGIICLSASIMAYLFKETSLLERVVLFAAALLLIKPGWITDLIGLVCLGSVMIHQLGITAFGRLLLFKWKS
jgi:TRAP transporter 4TM/12TM fusion protein